MLKPLCKICGTRHGGWASKVFFCPVCNSRCPCDNMPYQETWFHCEICRKPVMARISATWHSKPELLDKLIEAELRKSMGDEAYEAYHAKLIMDYRARIKAKNDQGKIELRKYMKEYLAKLDK